MSNRTIFTQSDDKMMVKFLAKERGISRGATLSYEKFVRKEGSHHSKQQWRDHYRFFHGRFDYYIERYQVENNIPVEKPFALGVPIKDRSSPSVFEKDYLVAEFISLKESDYERGRKDEALYEALAETTDKRFQWCTTQSSYALRQRYIKHPLYLDALLDGYKKSHSNLNNAANPFSPANCSASASKGPVTNDLKRKRDDREEDVGTRDNPKRTTRPEAHMRFPSFSGGITEERTSTDAAKNSSALGIESGYSYNAESARTFDSESKAVDAVSTNDDIRQTPVPTSSLIFKRATSSPRSIQANSILPLGRFSSISSGNSSLSSSIQSQLSPQSPSLSLPSASHPGPSQAANSFGSMKSTIPCPETRPTESSGGSVQSRLSGGTPESDAIVKNFIASRSRTSGLDAHWVQYIYQQSKSFAKAEDIVAYLGQGTGTIASGHLQLLDSLIRSHARRYDLDEGLVKCIYSRVDDFEKGEAIVGYLGLKEAEVDGASSEPLSEQIVAEHSQLYSLDQSVLRVLYARDFEKSERMLSRATPTTSNGSSSQTSYTHTPTAIIDSFMISEGQKHGLPSVVLRAIYLMTADFVKAQDLVTNLGRAKVYHLCVFLNSLVRAHAAKSRLEPLLVKTIYERATNFDLAEQEVARLSRSNTGAGLVGMETSSMILFNKLVTAKSKKCKLAESVVHRVFERAGFLEAEAFLDSIASV